ncbi:unnamed protein product [Trichobilharzia szidati]|nr:unnamed protein product [Trichobilharzia szidati]
MKLHNGVSSSWIIQYVQMRSVLFTLFTISQIYAKFETGHPLPFHQRNRNERCVIYEEPKSCEKVANTKNPLYTHFGIFTEILDDQMKPISVQDFERVPINERFEYFTRRSCDFIMSRITTEQTPYYERPSCTVADFIPSDANTVFAVHDIVYNSIRATQLSENLLLDTFIQNSRFYNLSFNLQNFNFRIVSNTMKRVCSDCHNVCPPHSHCVDIMNGIKCVCNFGWQYVGGYSRSEYCRLHPTVLALLILGTILLIAFTVLTIYLMHRVKHRFVITTSLKRISFDYDDGEANLNNMHRYNMNYNHNS